ncbi:hypothetical protein, partial [Sedimentitalea sp.]|uniref:hypothetical protein n=1 Tax=Sedimentitalea sp. TaxID=2048915 RepID=UPI0032991440
AMSLENVLCQIKADDGNLCHNDASFRALCCDVTMTAHCDARRWRHPHGVIAGASRLEQT